MWSAVTTSAMLCETIGNLYRIRLLVSEHCLSRGVAEPSSGSSYSREHGLESESLLLWTDPLHVSVEH